MDGKGRYSDNIFVERLWRTVKYEEVYLKADTDRRQAKTVLEAASTATTPNGLIKPWATGHRPRFSTETRCNQMNSLQRGAGHQAEHWQTLGRQRDPHLMLLQYCPTDGVHLSLRPYYLVGKPKTHRRQSAKRTNM